MELMNLLKRVPGISAEHLFVDRLIIDPALRFLQGETGKKVVDVYEQQVREINDLLKRCRPYINDFINVWLEEDYKADGRKARQGFKNARNDRLEKKEKPYGPAPREHYKANDENRLDLVLARKLDAYLVKNPDFTPDAEYIFQLRRTFGPAILRLGIMADEDRRQFDAEVEYETDDLWPKRAEEVIDTVRPVVTQGSDTLSDIVYGLFGGRL